MTGGEIQESIRRVAGGIVSWAKQFDLFTCIILFTLGGHLLLALALNAARSSGADFPALDPDHTKIPAIQIGLFAAQTALVIFAVARSGIKPGKTLAGVAALIWAASMLMLTIVSAQCDLFGACL